MHSAWPTLPPVVPRSFRKVTAHRDTRKKATLRFLQTLHGNGATFRRNFHNSSVGGSSSPPRSLLIVPCVLPSPATTLAATPASLSFDASHCDCALVSSRVA